MPVFFIGLILIQYVGFKWGLTGRTGPIWDGGLPSLILPALTLGLVLIGPIARLTRTAVLEVLGADFVRTARAKGLRETVVIVHHALRNALIPVVTLIGLQAAFLLGGAVVTETMFSWPGVGRLAVGAIVSSDFPTAQGAIMILAIAIGGEGCPLLHQGAQRDGLPCQPSALECGHSLARNTWRGNQQDFCRYERTLCRHCLE